MKSRIETMISKTEESTRRASLAAAPAAPGHWAESRRLLFGIVPHAQKEIVL
jgi:hypothetical protein